MDFTGRFKVLHSPSPSMCTVPSNDRQSGRTIIIIIIQLDPCTNLIRPPSSLILEHDTTPFLLNRQCRH
ncbi:hypothetical protein R3I94_019463 [Phoxinus phoxinus]